MVLIDFLNKTIPGGGKNFFFALRAKSCPPLAKILCTRLISGFVQRKLSQKLKCKACTDVITSSAPDKERLNLTFMKDRGGLTYASHEISKVSEIAESKIQDAQMKDKLFCDRQILNRICLKTVSTCMTEHPYIFKKADHGELHKYSLLREKKSKRVTSLFVLL